MKAPMKNRLHAILVLLLLLWALFLNLSIVEGKESEIAYDDGDFEVEFTWAPSPFTEGYMLAVLFSPPDTPFKLLEASFNIEDPARFRVRVFDSNRQPLPVEHTVEPTRDGWIRVDLRRFNIELQGDFYIALEYLVPGKPWLSGDTSNPRGRSFWVHGSEWEPVKQVATKRNDPRWDTNFAIRATIALPHRVTLDIQPKDIPRTAGIMLIDGVAHDWSRFPIQFKWIQGSKHSISIINSVLEGSVAGVRYVFDRWSDGSTDVFRTITVSQDMSLTAIYRMQYMLTIESEFGQVEGAGWYNEGSRATISIRNPVVEVRPGVRMVFDRWIGDITSSERDTSILMGSPKKIAAVWKKQYLLTVDPNGGTVSGGGWYDEGTIATVSATSPSGVVEGQSRLVFTGWSGDVSSPSPQITIPMTQPRHVSANWKTQFYLTIDPGQGEVDETSQWVDAGASVTVRAKSPSRVLEFRLRLTFIGWEGSVVSPEQTITITMDMYKKIAARWKTQYYLRVISELGDPKGEGWYDAGSSAAFSVTTPLGFLIQDVFEEWSGDSQIRSASGTIIMDSTKMVVAKWRKDYTQLLLLATAVFGALSTVLFIMARRRKLQTPPKARKPRLIQ